MKGRQQSRTRYYVVQVLGDVVPEMHGPYETAYKRDRVALALRAGDPLLENGIFKLDQLPNGELIIDSYSGGFFEKRA